MILVQGPVPPAPPIPPPPFDPNLMPAPLIVMIVLAALAAGTIILWPLVRALARRLEGKGADPELRGEVDQLRARLADVDTLQHRVAELEDRLDFAERLLTRGQESPSTSGRDHHP